MQIANEDIVCYKLIQICHRPNGDNYRSYFQHTKLKLNEPITALDSFHSVDILSNKRRLYGEVVHAYRYISCDDIDMDFYIRNTASDPRLRGFDVSIAKIECIIPKGTLFCIGYDDDNNPCYGALKIIPKKVIEIISTIRRHE